MKRVRGEDTSFGGRATGPQGSNNRILTTANPGQTVQFQMTPSVLRTSSATNENTGLGQGPTVQYTTTYSNSQLTAGNLTRSVTPSQPGGPPPTPQHISVTAPVNAANTLRHKTAQGNQPPPTITTFVGASPQNVQPPPGQTQFQRLKVEDALSYLDKVKYKFEKQPQVYNDFLDIMKEFKSQTIDTPGVIQRVSNLFKGHPELIVGFNTFLPPGYKIEVQANDQGYAYQVSVSLPPTSTGSGISQPSPPHRGQIQMVHTIPTAVNLMTHQNVIPQNLHASNTHQSAPIPTAVATTTPTLTFSRERTISGSGGAHSNISTGNTSIATSNNSTNQSINTTANAQGIRNDINEINHLHHLSHSSVISQESNTGANIISSGISGGGAQGGAGSASSATAGAPVSGGATQNQPVEFNHAISYVNKIKNRFHNQPEKYKKFLEILHTYQKEQKIVKEVGGAAASPNKLLTEAEVYTQVAKLFDKQEDLLREFGQFLPDATNHSGLHLSKFQQINDHKKLSNISAGVQHANLKSYNNSQNNISRLERDYHQVEKDYVREKERNHIVNQKFGTNSAQVKKSPSYNAIPVSHIGRDREGPPPPKRHKPICRDVTLAEASKYGSLHDYAFFDKVRKALRSPEVYDNFLRCLTLYNQEIISKSELLNLVSPFLSKFPDLQRWFQEFIGPSTVPESVPLVSAQRQDRTQSELAQEIDLSSCKRLGASYCALPKTSDTRKCSGRTLLCKEVLNDTWVSFPTWAEDSTFVTSRKTQYEEIIYRCEDERFELDVVIETNSATIRVLEGVQKKLSRMTPEEVSRFRLNDCLGGNSPTIHKRAIRRIYGDKSADVIQGLMGNPVVAVPIVLRRLKAKEEEWREAQKGFNKQWREQNEKYYLKSLDHQGITFKQNDIKALRSKSLFNEIETLFDERHEQNDEGTSEPVTGPHLVLNYKDKTILEDAANLLIHHVKRQTGIQKQEKTKIKHILRQFIPDIFFAPRQQLSDDERDEEDKEMEVDNSDNENKSTTNLPLGGGSINNSMANNKLSTDMKKKNLGTSSNIQTPSNTSQQIMPSSTSTNSSTLLSSNLPNIKSESDETRTQNLVNDMCNVNSSNNNNINNNNISTDNPNFKNNDGGVKNEVEIKLEKDCDTTGTLPSSNTNNKSVEEAYTLFFANNNWYLFLRLHAILCERLRSMYERAQMLAIEEAKYRSNRRESTATALRLKPKSEIQVEDYYPTFLDMLKNVLDGNLDSNNYEDNLREMFGIHAYISFTLDRVVSNAVRQLQHCVTERGATECVDLFHQEQRKGGAGGLCKTSSKRLSAELTYQRKAEASLQDENCFKIYIYKIECRVTIELLDTESDDTEKTIITQQSWSNYVERLANPAANPMGSNHRTNDGTNSNKIEIKTEKEDELVSIPRKPLFLSRNIKRFNDKHNHNQQQNSTSDDIQIENNSGIDGNNKNYRKDDGILRTELSGNSNNNNNISVNSTDVVDSNEGNKKNLLNVEEALWKKGPPERLGNDVNNSYYVDDKTEIRLNIQSYKMVYIMDKDGIFYKRNSINRARMTHPKITKSRQQKFYKFIRKWLDSNTNETHHSQCSDWLLGKSSDLVPNITKIIQENDITKTPYSIYNRYKVERLES